MSEPQLHWEDVSALWEPYEEVADSLEDVLRFTAQLNEGGRRFVWRGQADHRWGVTSALYRKFLLAGTALDAGTEARMVAAEQAILARLRDWGFRYSQGSGHDAALSQFANLQHYGFPTRLVDVSSNPLVAAWFCTEDEAMHDIDGRIFAIEVGGRDLAHRRPDWETSALLPWTKIENADEYADWRIDYYVWTPPQVNERLAAQGGGFLVGGAPLRSVAVAGKQPTFNISTPSSSNNSGWHMDDVRQALSLAIRPHVFGKKLREVNHPATYVLRVTARAKAEILQALGNIYGYSYATLFPDYSGVAENADKIFAAEWAQMVGQQNPSRIAEPQREIRITTRKDPQARAELDTLVKEILEGEEA